MFLTGFILCLKKVIAIPHGFIKMFHLHQSRYFAFSMLQQPYRAYQELVQGDFYSFDQEIVFFLLIYLLPTQKKCNGRKNHTYLNLVYSICQRVDIYKACKTFDFFFLLLFLLSSPASTTALRFPHYSSPMNISLGKAIKFFLNCNNYLWGVSSSIKTWFCSRTKLERFLFCEKRFAYFVSYHNNYLFLQLCQKKL